ncbi:hypothetical protein DER46DRAFT_566902 [Fusarium sp. MPI-SDFR-AT-0072]|nr:hypothetical protein DER46DRAFT_566902 [Fusarium sp. MPI-SDFR-AT-0072]
MDRLMAKLLLEHKADPNKIAFSHRDRSVWALFLISCWGSVNRREATLVSIKEWFEVSKLLIDSGVNFRLLQSSGLELLGKYGRCSGGNFRRVASFDTAPINGEQTAGGTW